MRFWVPDLKNSLGIQEKKINFKNTILTPRKKENSGQMYLSDMHNMLELIWKFEIPGPRPLKPCPQKTPNNSLGLQIDLCNNSLFMSELSLELPALLSLCDLLLSVHPLTGHKL